LLAPALACAHAQPTICRAGWELQHLPAPPPSHLVQSFPNPSHSCTSWCATLYRTRHDLSCSGGVGGPGWGPGCVQQAFPQHAPWCAPTDQGAHQAAAPPEPPSNPACPTPARTWANLWMMGSRCVRASSGDRADANALQLSTASRRTESCTAWGGVEWGAVWVARPSAVNRPVVQAQPTQAGHCAPARTRSHHPG